MNRRLVDLYHRAPPRARSVVASLRGFQLHWWRYSPQTDTLAEEALAREHWPRERWEEWQAEPLRRLLDRAARQVPYYREYWQSRNADPADWLALEHWPILTKEEVRNEPRSFLADDCNPKRMFRLSTSGTSGSPLTMWRSRATSIAWYALFEARWRRWYGVTRTDRWAILGGQLVAPVGQDDPPFWVWNQGLRQLYMSTLHISRETAAAYLHALHRYRVRYMYGYASSMSELAHYALELGIEAPRLEVAISNAEPLLPHHREAIEKAFGCRARDTYGMAEIVTAASECSEGRLHRWPEAGIVEIIGDGDAPSPPGTPGRFICTGLLNPDMPLIRYDVGDRGLLDDAAGTCGCGRRLPRFARIEGRTIDNIVTRDGRKIFWLNPVFYGLPIKEAQIIQEDLHRIRVHVVPAPGFADAERRAIAARLRERVGDVEIAVEVVESVARTERGKFRAVVSMVHAARG